MPNLNALVQRTGIRFGGWPQALSILALLAVAVVVNLHLIPAWSLTAPAVLLALTTFGVKGGLKVSYHAAVLLTPAFQPLTAPVCAALAGLYLGYVGTRRHNFAIGLFAVLAGFALYVGYIQVAFRFLIPALHVVTLKAWAVMPATVIGLLALYLGYRYLRSSYQRENWLALFLSAANGALWSVLPICVFLKAGMNDTGAMQYLYPIMAICVAGAFSLLVFVLTLRAARTDNQNWFKAELKVFGMSALWFVVPFSVFSSTHERFVALMMRYSMDVEYVQAMPYSKNDRIVTQNTASSYIQSLNRDTNSTIDLPHIQLREDGKMVWQSPVHDLRLEGRILGSVPNVLTIDADSGKSHPEETPNSGFRYGNASWISKAAFAARHPLSEVAEYACYQQKDGSWVTLLSYVSRRPTWTGTMIPYMAGVMAIDQEGVITDYSVEEADKLFPGAAFYPEGLQLQYANAYGMWREGFWTTWVGQTGMLEVARAHSDDFKANRPPYNTNWEGWGLQGVIEFEPLGVNQYAAVEYMWFDASTGKIRAWPVPKDLPLNTASQCVQQVRNADPSADWSLRDSAEPRVLNGPRGQYELITIVANKPNEPNNRAYIFSVLVDCKSKKAHKMMTGDEIRAFMAQPRTPADDKD
ncbi:MAG: hypothetical protein K2W82_10765 [Candidatus Obscuribacterales bacterium]|nr:hypothetical protein [Candidatus Obscuribacterales bacterium]